MDEPGMTDAQINRAIAEKLEPWEDIASKFCKDAHNRSPLELWEWVGCDWAPRLFHNDPAAMMALMSEIAKNPVYLRMFVFAVLWGATGTDNPTFVLEYFIRGLSPRFVRDAAAEALEIGDIEKIKVKKCSTCYYI